MCLEVLKTAFHVLLAVSSTYILIRYGLIRLSRAAQRQIALERMITILGPTASGKTALAVALAAEIRGEIISADSRQVYKRMDIGTGKDLCEYEFNGRSIPYHLIDIAEPGTKYNVFEYQKDFIRAYDNITSRGMVPVMCGGTGLYIESVLKGYSLAPVPENKPLRAELAGKSLNELTEILSSLKKENSSNMHNTTDVDTAKRAIRAIEIETYNKEHGAEAGNGFPKIDSSIIGVAIDRDERRKKITQRLRQRLDNGLVEEVRGLMDEGISAEDLMYYGLEYKFVTEYVVGKISRDGMFRLLEIAIHQFAKRQMTWFRGMERRGLKINWVDAKLPMDEKVGMIKDVYYKEVGLCKQDKP